MGIGINGLRLSRPLWVSTTPDDYATLQTNYEVRYETCKYLFVINEQRITCKYG